MFVISAGMPKSGSTLFSHYQRETIGKIFGLKGQLSFEQSIIEGTIPGLGHFIEHCNSFELLERLYEISLSSGPFIAKTHAGPSPIIAEFVTTHDVKITYIHRDPRDVILSAIDHGKRPVKNIAANTYFLLFDSVEHSVPMVRQFCRTGLQWIESGLCSVFTYHQLLSDPRCTLNRFAELLGGSVDEEFCMTLIKRYTEGQVRGKRQFNTGKLFRFSSEMSVSEIEFCQRELGDEISRLGY